MTREATGTFPKSEAQAGAVAERERRGDPSIAAAVPRALLPRTHTRGAPAAAGSAATAAQDADALGSRLVSRRRWPPRTCRYGGSPTTRC